MEEVVVGRVVGKRQADEVTLLRWFSHGVTSP